MTTLILDWSDWDGPASGWVTLTRRSWRRDPDTYQVPWQVSLRVEGRTVTDVRAVAGEVVSIRWAPDGVSSRLEHVLVPDDGEHLAHLLERVDPATLEPLPEEQALTAAQMMAQVQAEVERLTAAEAVKGDDGRGIASVTADGETATVTYTDGSTELLPLPAGTPGDDGVSIVDVTAADGVATVSLSDGTTRRITLPPGEAGRAPVLTWEGTRLLVDGVPGPDLRGPAGPAPSVAWSGDRLTVGGETGPSLTGPQSTTPGPAPSIKIGTVTSGGTASATITGTSPDLTLGLVLPKGEPGGKGDPGAPGALANASSYVIVGPGRPDVPSTTAGTVTGAEPVGARYESVDEAGVGARTWRKVAGGKWAVTDGDTGARKLAASAAMTSVYPNNGTYVQRIGPIVHFSLVDLTGSGNNVNVIAGGMPNGFRPGLNRNYTGVAGDEGTVRVLVMNTQVRVQTLSRGQVNVSGSYPTTDPWPTAPLPGDPA